MAVHEVTVARSGAGKTYHIVYRLIYDWLPFPHNRNFFTNLPLKVDAIAEYFVQHHPELVSSAVLDRIKLFDQTVTDSWLNEKSGPWDYFESADMDGGRIVIDEVHNFVHLKSSPDYIMKWRRWLGELRHCGCTFEAISQYETKIHPLIRHECGLIRRLSSADDKRDKVFWIKWYDHFQILSKIRGYYSSRVFFGEFTEENGKWDKTGGGSFPIHPLIYNLYNSYSAPIAKGGQAAKINPHPFGRMTWPELLKWYFQRNGFRMFACTIVYGILIWLFCFNGIINIFMSVTDSITKPKTAEKATSESPSAGKLTAEKASSGKEHALQEKPVDRPCLYTPYGIFTVSGARFVPSSAAAKPAIGVGIHGQINGPGAGAEKLGTGDRSSPR